MGVRKIEESLCTGCGICFENCPFDVFRMDEEREKAFIKYLSDCTSCFLCEIECPEDAIYCTPDREMRIPRPY
jgi:NAD-dependent dihydropyrimidine dehydrogenase PreA subunit